MNKPRSTRDKRLLVGNDVIAGNNYSLRRRQVEQAFRDNAELLQARRQRMIDLTAKAPLPPAVAQAVPATSVSFNQLAYSVLLIAILATIAVATPFINWAFLVYGIIAVLARFPSRIIFSSALISLVIIPLTSALSRVTLANVFAVMTFYFLVIGLVRAALELRREQRTNTDS